MTGSREEALKGTPPLLYPTSIGAARARSEMPKTAGDPLARYPFGYILRLIAAGIVLSPAASA
jgi:hypothetical protein